MNFQNTSQPNSNTPDKNELRNLKELLDEEIRIYTDVEKKMAAKKQCLIKNDIENLQKLDQELMRLSQKSAEIEKRRVALMLMMGYKDQTLEEFIQSLDGNNAKPFIEARQNLLRVVSDIRQLNRNNRELLDLAIKWIEGSVEVIASLLVPESASYNAQGGKTDTRQNRQNLVIGQSTVDRSV